MNRINLPEEIAELLSGGATLAISISGGKDSQAMITAVMKEARRQRWPGPIVAIHADLGRLEWLGTGDHCQKMAAEAGIELVTVRRQKGDMFDRWYDRMIQLKGTGRPFWSSSSARYCTSDMKRDPIDKQLRKYSGVVISAEGIRAAESVARAKKQCMEPRKRITTKSGSRVAYTWRPIFDWSDRQVWEEIGVSLEELEERRALYRSGDTAAALEGWPAHAAYVYGNTRLSCVFCVLASKNDLANGAKHRPELLKDLIALEEEGEATFKNGFSLKELL